jgi:hypothetical protein
MFHLSGAAAPGKLSVMVLLTQRDDATEQVRREDGAGGTLLSGGDVSGHLFASCFCFPEAKLHGKYQFFQNGQSMNK